MGYNQAWGRRPQSHAANLGIHVFHVQYSMPLRSHFVDDHSKRPDELQLLSFLSQFPVNRVSDSRTLALVSCFTSSCLPQHAMLCDIDESWFLDS